MMLDMVHRHVNRVVAVCLVLVGVWVAGPSGTSAAARAPRDPAAKDTGPAATGSPRVTVTRDSWGIPHVTAPDFGSLGYGEGYAFAQDNLCTFADDVVTLRGERTQYFGADGVAESYANGASDPNPKSDLYWTEVRTSGVVARQVAGLDPEIRALYAGFAAGYNALLASPSFTDPTCKGKPWVQPITVEDLYLRGYQLVTLASSGVFESDLVDAQPPFGTQTSPTPPPRPGARRSPMPPPRAHPAFSKLLPARAARTDPGLGSNAIGLGSRGTRPGIAGMVLANPHFPWRGTERFWVAQLTVPGRYDMLGGTLFGFPLIGVGFNRHLAWTSTNTTGMRFVVMKLKLAPGDPTSYVVDGKKIAMTRHMVRSNGVDHTFYNTEYGPVLVIPQAGYSWTPTEAYALFDPNAHSLAVAANEYLAMGRTSTVRSLLTVLRTYVAIPEFNIIASDDRGETLYANVGTYPRVTKETVSRCIPPGVPQLAYATAGLVTLDGSRSSCTIGSTGDTPRPGILSAQMLPATIRRDWVENSNDSYWLANPQHPFREYSPILGPYQVPQLFRTRQGNLMIEARLAGTDGLGRPGFDIASMEQLLGRFENYGGALVSGQLASACDAHPVITLPSGASVDVRAACPVLRAYRGTGLLDDPGAWLFTTWLNDIPSGFPWLDRFDPSNPLNTPRVLDPNAPDTLNALGEAVQELRNAGVPLDATLGQVVYTNQTPTPTPIAGCFGCFETIDASHGPASGAPYGQILFGDSLIMMTELRRNGPRSVGTLTYSEATDPTSPWHSNLTTLYARGKFVPFLYTAAALRADVGARTEQLPGRGIGSRSG